MLKKLNFKYIGNNDLLLRSICKLVNLRIKIELNKIDFKLGRIILVDLNQNSNRLIKILYTDGNKEWINMNTIIFHIKKNKHYGGVRRNQNGKIIKPNKSTKAFDPNTEQKYIFMQINVIHTYDTDQINLV